jgi:hypothetical protein
MRGIAVVAGIAVGALALPAAAFGAADVAITMSDAPDPVGEEAIVT